MRSLIALLIAISSANVLASGGFTFISDIQHKLHTHIPEHIVTFCLIAIVTILLGLLYRVKLSSAKDIVIPDKGISYRNIAESFSDFIYNLTVSTMGKKEAKKYFPIIAGIFFLVFFSNLIGLVPGFLPPTDNINTTLALGMFVFFYYNLHGVKEQGLIGHIKHFMGPVWYLSFLILPIELISHAVRPLSLGLRLRGNMFGDHLVLSIFSDLLPYIVPIVFLVLGLFVCFIQAFVFTLLTMVYISLSVAKHDHAEHEAH
jgi:F-type H+-transporting ATPase subunit a